MALKYVWNGAVGTGDGSSWANAFTTLKASAEAAATVAGDTHYVAHDHNESAAAGYTITFKATAAAPSYVACVNRAGSVPPVDADRRATAVITTTGASALTLQNSAGGALTYIEGLIFNLGSGAVAGVALIITGGAIGIRLKNCRYNKVATAGNQLLRVGLGATLILDNFILQTAAPNDNILNGGRLVWSGGSILVTGSGSYQYGFQHTTATGVVEVSDVDMIGFGTAAMSDNWGVYSKVSFTNCKLAAGAVLSSGGAYVTDANIDMINCDSGGTNYRTERKGGLGSHVMETVIVRAGSASDGVTPVSWKIVTVANTKWLLPFESLPLRVWNNSLGQRVVSVYGWWNNASPPNSDDIWIEAEYLGSAAQPLGSIVSSTKSGFLATGVPVSIDGSTWAGAAGATKFKLSVPLTINMKGLIVVRVKVGKPSATCYIDPKLEVL